VRLWRKRAVQEGLKSLWQIARGRGRKPTHDPEKIQAIIHTTLQSKPKGRTQELPVFGPAPGGERIEQHLAPP
jgi:hypothetical protein